MNHPWASGQFPGRISRRLSLTFAGVLAIALTVGGISLILSTRIHRINDAVDQENAHILITAQIQSAFGDIISELQRMEAIGRSDRVDGVQALHDTLRRHLESFRTLHQGDKDFPEEQESALLSDLKDLAAVLQALTDRAPAAQTRGQRLGLGAFDELSLISRQVATKTADLSIVHRLRLTGHLQASERMMRVIVALYLTSLLVSAILIVTASIAFGGGWPRPPWGSHRGAWGSGSLSVPPTRSASSPTHSTSWPTTWKPANAS